MKNIFCKNLAWSLLVLVLMCLVVMTGCDVDTHQGEINEDGNTLLSAIKKNDFSAIQDMLAQNTDLINEEVSSQGALLHLAVYHDSEKLLRLLLAHGADVNIERKPYRSTPLHDAAVQGRYNMAMLLLENGADVDCRDQFSRTPLHRACSSLSATSKFVSLLLSHGADVDARTERGETPLCIACQWLKEDKEGLGIIDLLLSNGADPSTDCLYDAPDLSLMHITLAKRSFEIAQLLIDYGAILELKTEEGMCSFTVDEVRELYQALEESQQ